MVAYPKAIPKELEQSQADRIAKSLKSAGMSHSDMAEHMEMHRNTIGAYVTGKSKMLPIIMRLWAEKVGVPLEWLRDGVWPSGEPSTAAAANVIQAESAPKKSANRKPEARPTRRISGR